MVEVSGHRWQGAVTEAARCLYCHDAPCTRGCPAGIDVPAFVKRIQSGNLRGAARVIREANLLGGICARVCPSEQLCERECSARLLERPIPIARLQQVACDWEMERGICLLGAPRQARVGGRAAVVGGGPAGLVAAHELLRAGWEVIVYEASQVAGGQPALAIPEHRLPRQVVEQEVGAVLAAGGKLVTGVRVGRDLTAAHLLEENRAVILATGLGGSPSLPVPGADVAGVERAEEFLAAARTAGAAAGAAACSASAGADDGLAGRKVVVIGAGNTAMDAACTARRRGADRVTVLYRRTSREMPAWPREYREAVETGVEFLWLAQPVEFLGEGGALRVVRCQRTELGAVDATGRPQPRPVPGSEFVLEADLALLALGQSPDRELVEAFDLVTEEGRVKVDPVTGCTSRERVFAAGDLANGGATVVQAVAEGKKVGRYVASSL